MFSFKNLILIAGGYDKNLDYNVLAKPILDNCKALILLGQTADKIEKAVKAEINVKDEVYKYISDNNIELTNSNKFFIERTIKNVKYLIEILKKQNSFCSLKKVDTDYN